MKPIGGGDVADYFQDLFAITTAGAAARSTRMACTSSRVVDLRKFLDLFWDYRLKLLKDEVEAAEEQKKTAQRDTEISRNESTDHQADSD